MFLLGCYSKWFSPVHFWWIGLLTISAFYWLILLLLFFIFWLFVKPRYCLIFLISVGLAWRPIHKVIPFRSVPDFEVQKQAAAIRVMSWNVAQFNIMDTKKHPEIKQQMLELVNQYQPDIVCFQEMVASDSLVDLNTPYYHRYNYYDLNEFLKKLHFDQYFYSYNSKENFLDRQHFGVILFSRYPIINRQTVSNYPHDYNSIFQYADIVRNGDTIRVFNIHLQSLKFSPKNLHYIDNPSLENEEDIEKSKNILSKFKRGFIRRSIQAESIRKEIEQSPYPVMVCGDFNDLPNSYAYEKIGKGLLNAFEEKGDGLGRTFSGISPTLRIDNIFVDPRYKIEQYVRIKKKLSDHFPIITDILQKDIK